MKILFFASLREQLATAELELATQNQATTAREVLHRLQGQGELWQRTLDASRLRVAINQELAQLDDPVSEHDELAFFPPVTGG